MWREESECWETAGFSANQETPLFVWKPSVQYHVHNSPPLVLVLSQINPCVSLVSRSGVAEVAVFLEYDVTSLGILLPAFRGNKAVSSSKSEMSKISALGISMPEEETITFSREVGYRLHSDVTSYPRRKKLRTKFSARHHVRFLYFTVSSSLQN